VQKQKKTESRKQKTGEESKKKEELRKSKYRLTLK